VAGHWITYSLNDYGGQSNIKMFIPNRTLTDTLCISDLAVISIITTRKGNTRHWTNKHPLKYSRGQQSYSGMSDFGDGQVTARFASRQ